MRSVGVKAAAMVGGVVLLVLGLSCGGRANRSGPSIPSIGSVPEPLLVFEFAPVSLLEDSVYFEALKSIGAGKGVLRLDMDHGVVADRLVPQYVRMSASNPDVADEGIRGSAGEGRSVWFQRAMLTSHEVIGDDPWTWNVTFWWRGPLRELSHEPSRCVLVAYFDYSSPPDPGFRVAHFDEIEVQEASRGSWLVRLTFRLEDGSQSFPAGRGECLLSIPQECSED